MTAEERALQARRRSEWVGWLIPASLAVAFTAIIWLAPNERLLGSGIKAVYAHVALMWTGMLGFAVAGLLGLALAILARPLLQSWMRAVGWVALAFYAAGAAMSIVAAHVNWGGVLWSEPRMSATLIGLAVSAIVLVVSGWLPWRRAQGLLGAGLAAYLIVSLRSAPLLFHPPNAVEASSSVAIQLTFAALFGLSGAAAVWLIGFVRRRWPGP